MGEFKKYIEYITEGVDVGYDKTASTYNKTIPTKPQGPKKITLDDVSDTSLGTKAVRAKVVSLMNKGFKATKKFVEDTDFSKYKFNNNRSSDTSNYEDKAFIYYTFLNYIGAYSQYKLTWQDWVLIGIKGNLNDYEIVNENWSGKFGSGATESFPENRPQLRLQRKSNLDLNKVNDLIRKNIPGIIIIDK